MKSFLRTLAWTGLVVVGLGGRCIAQGPPVPVQDTCRQLGPWTLPSLPLPGKFVPADHEMLRRCPLDAVVVVRVIKVIIGRVEMERAWLSLDRGKLLRIQMLSSEANFIKIQRMVTAELGYPSKVVFDGKNQSMEWAMKTRQPVAALLVQNAAAHTCTLTLRPLSKH